MPPLNEGDILFMPTAVPGISIAEATKILQIQDRMVRQFHEVENVFGKAGESETSTDPAPLSMIETVVKLKPPEQWRPESRRRWYSNWAPEWARKGLRKVWPDVRPITWEALI